MRKNTKELFMGDYITLKECKIIIIKIDIETARKLDKISKEEYKEFIEALEKGELDSLKIR